MVDTGGAVWTNCSPEFLWRFVEWRPFYINAPVFGDYRTEAEIKKYSKLNNALHCVELHDSSFNHSLYHYQTVSTMLFFLIILLFHYFFSAWEPPSLTQVITNDIAGTVVALPLGCAKLVWFCHKLIFLCLMAALQGKLVAKIGMQYGKLIVIIDTRV